ncbi:MAG: hypothetical protein M3Q97_11505 [Bacteroidota bacterium]|nr:hypothetical protein [Bacteroidota bacterium]
MKSNILCNSFAALLIIFSLQAFTYNSTPSDKIWNDYINEKYKVKISFPESYTETTTKLKGINAKMLAVTSETGESMYQLIAIQIGENDNGKAYSIAKKFSENLAGNLGGSDMEYSDFDYNEEHRGRETLMNMDDDKQSLFRVIFANGVLYAFLQEAEAEYIRNEESEKFFESFTIME